MRSCRAGLLAAAFIAVATAPFAVAAAHAASAPARLVPPQATARLALQNNTPVPVRSTPVPLQADAAVPAPVQNAAAPKPEAGKQDAAAPDNKPDAGKDNQQDGKQDAAAPGSAQPAAPVQTAASNCPGNPNALGTSRVLAIDPADFKRIGHMQYPELLAAAG